MCERRDRIGEQAKKEEGGSSNLGMTSEDDEREEECWLKRNHASSNVNTCLVIILLKGCHHKLKFDGNHTRMGHNSNLCAKVNLSHHSLDST
jgi:hypothetical protein